MRQDSMETKCNNFLTLGLKVIYISCFQEYFSIFSFLTKKKDFINFLLVKIFLTWIFLLKILLIDFSLFL